MPSAWLPAGSPRRRRRPVPGQRGAPAGWRVAEGVGEGGVGAARGRGGLEAAVLGTYGPGPLNVALLVEYDALPEVGHACGHNVIAAASVGAAVALAPVAVRLGLRV